MTAPPARPVADPFDDLDRAGGVDSLMARQDRADLPGERSDEPNAGNGGGYVDPTRDPLTDAAADDVDADEDDADAELGDDEIDIDSDIDLARDTLDAPPTGVGADEDEPIDETEHVGDK